MYFHSVAYDDDDDKFTTQQFQYTMAISDSTTVTIINNATYQKSGMIAGRDELETLRRRRLWGVFFSIEVQVPIDGVKRNCSLLEPKHLISPTL
jgi:hypothetical protein